MCKWEPFCSLIYAFKHTLLWRHNEPDGVSNQLPHDCSLNRLFWRRSKKTSRLRITGRCARNSPVTGEFPAQRSSNAENVSIWWRHHDMDITENTRRDEMNEMGWRNLETSLHTLVTSPWPQRVVPCPPVKLNVEHLKMLVRRSQPRSDLQQCFHRWLS